MQSAKDTFYVALRDRVAAINPERTLVIRGATRLGVLVEENELASAYVAAEAFSLRWTSLSIDVSDGLLRMQCEIRYATDGSAGSGGMDRGRMLAAMDLELLRALGREPKNLVKTAYANAGATTMQTNVFWADSVYGKVSTEGERLSRTVTVEVMAYQEAGEA